MLQSVCDVTLAQRGKETEEGRVRGSKGEKKERRRQKRQSCCVTLYCTWLLVSSEDNSGFM